MNVSFDIDGTLIGYNGKPIPEMEAIIKKHIEDGDSVIIVTRRGENQNIAGWTGAAIKKYVKETFGNIPVIFTNHNPKWSFLKRRNIEKHYDDSSEEIQLIKDNTDIKTELVDFDKSKEAITREVDLKTKTVIVYDFGLFFSVARKLSEKFGKVYYYTPWQSRHPKSNDRLPGFGFDGVERIWKFWDYVEEADLFVFPDIICSDTQNMLKRMGKKVWGSGDAEEMEGERWDFKQYMKHIGLPVQHIEHIIGLKKLREHLQETEDKYIKVNSEFRGDFESDHHIDYDISEPFIDDQEFNLSIAGDRIDFVVEDSIPASSEIGYDGYCIDGEFPDKTVFGIEVKDLGYVGHVREYKDLPDGVKLVNEKLKKALKEYSYRANFSTEIRMGKEDGKPYLIDITARCGMPPIDLMLEMISNWPEIMWFGSQGIMTQPIFEAKCGAMLLICSPFANKHWAKIKYPPELERWIKQSNVCEIDGKRYTIPQSIESDLIGSIVAIDDTMEGAIAKVKDYASKIKGKGLIIDTECLDEQAQKILANKF